MKLLNTRPWFGARRWTNSWTMTNSPNASGKSRRSVLRVNRPFIDMDAHFRRMSRRCTSRTVTPMRSAHSDTAPFKSSESFHSLLAFISVVSSIDVPGGLSQDCGATRWVFCLDVNLDLQLTQVTAYGAPIKSPINPDVSGQAPDESPINRDRRD